MNILISGAASGIGYDLARVLAFRGHQVYACCHTKEQLQKRVGETTSNLHFIKLDITKEEDFSILKEIPFDCIVNQSGICIGGKLIDRIEDKKLEENFSVNVFGTMNLTNFYIKECQKEGRSGKVLITSSLLGYLPFPYLGCYASTKTTLTMLTKILHLELMLEKSPISIKLIEPGAYHTGFNQVMISDIEDEKINQILKKIFCLVETKDTRTIVNKMVKAIESKSHRLIYRAPCHQALLTKLYRIFSH